MIVDTPRDSLKLGTASSDKYTKSKPSLAVFPDSRLLIQHSAFNLQHLAKLVINDSICYLSLCFIVDCMALSQLSSIVDPFALKLRIRSVSKIVVSSLPLPLERPFYLLSAHGRDPCNGCWSS